MLGATALAVAAACAIALPLTLRAAPEPPPPRILKYTVVRELPHDPRAFTQGLQLDTHENRTIFWESTGMYGQSEVREVRPRPQGCRASVDSWRRSRRAAQHATCEPRALLCSAG